jgi:hypothetical protein
MIEAGQAMIAMKDMATSTTPSSPVDHYAVTVSGQQGKVCGIAMCEVKGGVNINRRPSMEHTSFVKYSRAESQPASQY